MGSHITTSVDNYSIGITYYSPFPRVRALVEYPRHFNVEAGRSRGECVSFAENRFFCRALLQKRPINFSLREVNVGVHAKRGAREGNVGGDWCSKSDTRSHRLGLHPRHLKSQFPVSNLVIPVSNLGLIWCFHCLSGVSSVQFGNYAHTRSLSSMGWLQ